MKPPTKKELQRLAVEALGEGAVVEVETRSPDDHAARAFGGEAWHPYLGIATDTRHEARIALAAALRALAEVRK